MRPIDDRQDALFARAVTDIRHWKDGCRGAGDKNKKSQWMNRIRPQRRYLKALRDKGLIEKSDYRSVYKKAKGGQYRSVSYLRNQLEEGNLIKTPSTSSRVRRR